MSVLKSDEIRAEMDKLQQEKDSIEGQVALAKRNAAQNQIYADAKWLTSAEQGIKWRGRKLHQLQVRLGKTLKEERAAETALQNAVVERAFVEAARFILPADTFRQIMAHALASRLDPPSEGASR